MHPTNSENPSNSKRGVFHIIRTFFVYIASLSFLVFVLAWMGGAFHTKIEPKKLEVNRQAIGNRKIISVEKKIIPEFTTAVGTVQPHRRTDIASQLLATIQEIPFRSGQAVKKGDILIVLDDRELLAQQREAIASLAAAEADEISRKIDYERNKGLSGSRSVSFEELNKLQGTFKVAQAQVRRIKETVSRIDVQLSYTRIKSPVAGVIADRFVDPGDLASPGKPLLTVYDPEDLELQANIPETIAHGVLLGQTLEIQIDASRWKCKGEVREIVPLAQTQSRSVLVKIAMPKASLLNASLPGMFGRVLIPVAEQEKILIPVQAVIRIGQLDLVDVVQEDGTLLRHFIRVGQVLDDKLEVLSGLTGKEKIALPK